MQVQLADPPVVQAVLTDLPGLLFFSTYTLLVLFWAEIYHQARSLPTSKLRPIFVTANAVVYLVQVGSWCTCAECVPRVEAHVRRLCRKPGSAAGSVMLMHLTRALDCSNNPHLSSIEELHGPHKHSLCSCRQGCGSSRRWRRVRRWRWAASPAACSWRS